MKIKRILVLFLAIITMMSMSACGGKKAAETTEENAPTAAESIPTEAAKEDTASDTAASEEKIVLRMGWWGSQTRHDKTIEVIELYESQNPNIDIEYEFYDSEGYFTKLNTLVASNEVWDMFQMGGNFPTYLSKIVPVDEYIASGIIDTSKTTEAFLKTTQYNGQQIGISNGVNTYGIAYDPALFAEAGVAEPTENWTWEDFENACMTIHEKLGIFGSSKIDDFAAGCGSFISQQDYSLNFYALTNDKLGFEDYSLLTDYIQMRADLVEAGAYPDPGAISEIKDIEGDFLVTGEAAMTWVASNQFIALSQAAGRELKLATIPRKTADGPAGAAIQSSQMLCISQDSQYPEEAAKFLNFFWTDEEANKILAGERGMSIFSNVLEAQAATMTEEQNYVNDFVALVGSFKTGNVNPVSPEPYQEITDNYNLTLQKVIYGELTADEAAKEFYDFAASKFVK